MDLCGRVGDKKISPGRFPEARLLFLALEKKIKLEVRKRSQKKEQKFLIFS